jgi:hypothetical protein
MILGWPDHNHILFQQVKECEDHDQNEEVFLVFFYKIKWGECMKNFLLLFLIIFSTGILA